MFFKLTDCDWSKLVAKLNLFYICTFTDQYDHIMLILNIILTT